MAEKGFGFIQGDDGKSYFVHSKSVPGGVLVDGQQVTFEGSPSPKGYRALNVVPGELPQPESKVFAEPDSFIWTQGNIPRGMEVVFWIAEGFWSESNDPNEAKRALIEHAKSFGASAAVNVRLVKRTEQAGCWN